MKRFERHGFTFIELMVVIFIIAIVSVSVFMRGTGSPNLKDTEAFANQLISQMRLLHQTSITHIATLGIVFRQDNYEFYQYSDKSDIHWTPLKDTDAFWKVYKIPSYLSLLFSSERANKSPQIIFYPNGIATSYVLKISTHNREQVLQIKGYEDGNTKLQVNPR